MSEERKELKSCPACESPGEQDSGKAWAKCTKPNCYNHLRWMPKKVWNSRPAEKRLEAALRMALSPMTPEELEEYAQPGCTGGEMSTANWTHLICMGCWNAKNPLVPAPDRRSAGLCCYCGKTTYGGIFVTDDIHDLPLCEGHDNLGRGPRFARTLLPWHYDETGGYIMDADNRMVAEIRGWGAGFSQTKIAEAIVAAPDLLAEVKEVKEKLGQARGQTIDAFTGPFVDGLGRRRMAYLSHYFLPSPEHPDWCQNCGCNQLDPLHLQLNETRSERIEKFKAATPQGAICP